MICGLFDSARGIHTVRVAIGRSPASWAHKPGRKSGCIAVAARKPPVGHGALRTSARTSGSNRCWPRRPAGCPRATTIFGPCRRLQEIQVSMSSKPSGLPGFASLLTAQHERRPRLRFDSPFRAAGQGQLVKLEEILAKSRNHLQRRDRVSTLNAVPPSSLESLS